MLNIVIFHSEHALIFFKEFLQQFEYHKIKKFDTVKPV